MAIQISIEKSLFLVPEKGDACQLWVSYFKTLQKELGNQNARMVWLITWKSNGDELCATNPSFHKWLISNEIDVSNIATRTLSDISEIGGNLFGLGKNLTKVLSIGVPVVLAVLLLGMLYVIGKSSKEVDISQAVKSLPSSKVLQLMP